ncbi:MAG: PP2C family protein-serine/threonine phosphatase [Chloroflexota bacterium]
MTSLLSTLRAVANLLDVNHDLLQATAQAWIGTGATYFGVWLQGDFIAYWPDAARPDGEALAAPLRLNGLTPELRVYGVSGPGCQARLDADARLIGHVTSLEAELNTMTQELIDNQDQLLALYDLTQSTRSSLETSDVLFALTREAARLIKAPAACAVLISNRPVEIVHFPEPILTQPMLMAFFGELQETGSRLLFQGDDGKRRPPDGISSLLMEPVRIRGQVMAALVFLNKNVGFSSPDLKLVRAIADQAGVQLENAQMYQESLTQAKMQTEMELAQNVQLHLLPHEPPEVAGLDIFAGSLPALQVGGDFYDYVYRPGEPFVFTVGDITGKGMPAALLMTMTRTVIRTKARSLADPSPANIVGSSNDDMYEDFTEVSMFATVFVGQYHHRDQTLYYANAGHSPVIYYPFGGSAYLLEADSTPMGVLPISTCENHALALGPGDILVVATDGFCEAQNQAGEMFGYDRLLRKVEDLASEAAWVIGTGLYDAISQFSAGHSQDDDQTLFVVKGV